MDALFQFSNISWSNLHNSDLNPFWFSLFGMSVVFCGLLIIALYIALLPQLLNWASGIKRRVEASRKQETETKSQENNLELPDADIITAIAVAFHLDQDFPEENQKITWLSHGVDDSAWLASGISHGVARRHVLHITRRKF